MIFSPDTVKSHVLNDGTALTIKDCVIKTLEYLKRYEIKIIATISDNARNITSALEKEYEDHNSVLPLRCASHVMNLIIKDAINKIPLINKAFKSLEKYIDEGVLKRYVATRWNSIYDRMLELIKILEDTDKNPKTKKKIRVAVSELEPMIDLLNMSLRDGMNWIDFYDKFTEFYEVAVEAEKNSLINILNNRRLLIKNAIIDLYFYRVFRSNSHL